MRESFSRIGIMGGAFNPIHFGHLIAAEEARLNFQLEIVFFVPSGVPVWEKEEPLLSGEVRYWLVTLAIADHPNFFPSRLEIEREGPSYTVDSLRWFHQVHPGAQLYFITGADALKNLNKWKEPKELLSLAELIAVSRPGFAFHREQLEPLHSRVHLLEIPGVAISSSEIRARLRKGLPIRYLVPEKVEEVIYKENLFRKEVPK